MPNERLVLGTTVAANHGLLLGRSLLVDQPGMGPSVRQTLRGIAEYLDEGIVHLDHGALMIGDEEPLLQGVHQGRAELVAIGEVFGAGPLFRETSGAVEEPPGGDVERGQRLQQEFQGYRPGRLPECLRVRRSA